MSLLGVELESGVSRKVARIVADNLFNGIEGLLTELDGDRIEVEVENSLMGTRFTYSGRMSDIEMI